MRNELVYRNMITRTRWRVQSERGLERGGTLTDAKSLDDFVSLGLGSKSWDQVKISEMQMKVLLMIVAMFFASGAFAADCVTNLRGKVVCANGEQAAAVNPNTGTVTTAQKYPNGATTAQTSNGQKAAYNPNTGTVTTSQKYANGATSAQNSNGTKAAYNPNTGTAAVSQKNQNGVTTTQTNWGGEAKTKNGMVVAQGPNGTTCAKGRNNQGCKKQ